MLKDIDSTLTADPEEYHNLLPKYQRVAAELCDLVYAEGLPVVIVFEGLDASGKGGAIRRLTEDLDPRGYVVHNVPLPQSNISLHHYLRPYWQRLPEKGQIAIFDHSWCSRVLLERVEGLCPETVWKRAYREINQFEQQLTEFGTICIKFWMHISKDEQLRRFESRQNDMLRRWKITDRDWYNREKWDLYQLAADDLLLKTNTAAAPWTIVEADNKHYARLKVFRSIIDRLSSALGVDPAAPLQSYANAQDKQKKKKKS